MKTRNRIALNLVGLGCLACQSTFAGTQPESVITPTSTQGDFTGSLTVKGYLFDYFDTPGHSGYTFLDRYNVRKGYNGNYRSGFFADVDFDLNYAYGDDKSLAVTRWGEGFYRHGGQLLWDEEAFAVTSYYNFLRTTTGSLGYQFSPNVVEGFFGPNVGVDQTYNPNNTNNASGYVSRHTFDFGDTDYHIDRFSYGVNFILKPGAFDETTRIELGWDGYLRDGLSWNPYVFGGSDLEQDPANPIDLLPGATLAGTIANQRWRAFSRDVDENMNRFTLKVVSSPNDWFDLSYAGSYEIFDNRSATLTFRDMRPYVAPYIINDTNARKTYNYVPDATRISNALTVKKQVGENTNLSAGYLHFMLEQDSFTEPQRFFGYNNGEIVNQEAFINFDTSFTPVFGMEGALRWGLRDNNSTFPAVGLIEPGNRGRLGTRISEIESWDTDLAALIRPDGWRSTFALGWRHIDKSRDLDYGNAKAPDNINIVSITPAVSLYNTDTEADEFYLRWSALNWNGFNLRVTGSYLTADQTGLVTEPEEAYGVKTAVTYTTENGVVCSAYYNYRSLDNNQQTFTDKVAPLLTYAQDISTTNQSAGAMISYNPAEDVNLYAGFDWMQMDASLIYFETNRRRYDPGTIFNPRDYSESTIDVYVLTFGGDYRVNEKLKMLASYSMTLTDGNLASGEIARELATVDDSLDNVLHTFALGAAYDIDSTKQLVIGYQFDHYQDDAYDQLSAGAHSIMTGLRFQF